MSFSENSSETILQIFPFISEYLCIIKHSFSYGIDLGKKIQKSTIVEFESNVIQRAKLNQFNCQSLTAAQDANIILKKKSALTVSCLFVEKEALKVQNNRGPFTYDVRFLGR